MDNVELLRQAYMESKTKELNARHECSMLARRLNERTAERDKAEQALRDLQHENDHLKHENAQYKSLYGDLKWMT